jgi:hypothetical protein
MPPVDLSDEEWQHLINIVATKATWAEANPLLMKIGEQLRRQQKPNSPLLREPESTRQQ